MKVVFHLVTACFRHFTSLEVAYQWSYYKACIECYICFL